MADTSVLPRGAACERNDRWKAPAATGVGALVGTAALGVVRPTDSGVPLCVSQGLFGIDCPLCGGLRCIGSLARADLWAAADHNVVLTLAAPLAVAAWTVWMVRSLQDRPLVLRAPPRWALMAIGVVLVAFTIGRNVGGTEALDWLASTRSS